jgi:Cu/Ag efflux pump CusA
VLGGLLTAVALLPLVILGGVVGAELLLPLAAVVWGGILTSWLLTLLVLPVLLLRVGVPDGDRGFDGEAARPALVEGTG